MSIETAAIFFDRPVPYGEAVGIQNLLVARRIEGSIPDTVLFLEHTPVVTMGVRTSAEHVLLPREALAEKGIELVETSRGGGVTYHAPGQVVMYPILKLEKLDADSHGYLHKLEQVAISAAGVYGVESFRREGMTGAWTESGKLAAIGVRFKRWVSFHGMSFNVGVDLGGFSTIVPCGLGGESVTSLGELLGADCPSMEDARETIARQFAEVFGRKLVPMSAA